MKTFTHFLCLCLFLFLVFSCNDDDMKVDPCEDQVETNADFDFFRRYSYQDTVYWFSQDTFYNSGVSKLYFRAKNSNMDAYAWKIGADPNIFTDSVFFLTFDPIEGPLDVSLTVTNDILEGCLLNEPNELTKTKSIYAKILNSESPRPLVGFFEGYDEDAPDEKYTIEITNIATIKGFPKNCTLCPSIISSFTKFVIPDGAGAFSCGTPIGTGYLEAGNQNLVIDYSIREANNSEHRINKRFIGTKIQ